MPHPSAPPPTLPPVVRRWEDVPEFPDALACRTFWRAHLMGPALFGLDPRDPDAGPAAARVSWRTYLDTEVLPVWDAVSVSLLLSLEQGKVAGISRHLADRVARLFDYPDSDALLRDEELTQRVEAEAAAGHESGPFRCGPEEGAPPGQVEAQPNAPG